MHNFFWDYLGFGVATLMQMTLAAAIFCRRLQRTWPSLLCYCCLALAFDAVMLSVSIRSQTYFVVYWLWLMVAPFLRLFVIGDVIRSIPASAIISRNIRLIIAAVATVLSACAGGASLHDGSPLKGLNHALSLIDGSVSIAWGVFLVVVLASIWASRLGWSEAGARVVIGLAIYVFGTMAAAYTFRFLPSHTHLYLSLRCACAITALSIWHWALATETPAEAPTEADLLTSGSPAY